MQACGSQSRAALFIPARKETELEVQQACNAAEVSHQLVARMGARGMKKAEEAGQVTLASCNPGGAAPLDYLDAQRVYRDKMRLCRQALFDEGISLCEPASSIGSGVQ